MAIDFALQAAQQVAAGPLDQALGLLQEFGFFRVVLPFLLVFSLVYALIIKTGVLGKSGEGPTNAIAAVVALVAALATIIYTPVVNALALLLPQASFLLVILVFLLIMFGMFGITEKSIGDAKWIAIPVGIILVLIFLAITGFAAGPSIPLLYGISQGLMGNIAIEIPEESIGLLLGFGVILTVVLGIIFLVTRASSSRLG
jgi:hypothetical protein